MKCIIAFRKHLIAGLARTTPLIVTGCALLTLNTFLKSGLTDNMYLSGIISTLHCLSQNSFTMTSSILSAAIAYSIAGRNAIIPGLVTGLMADAFSLDKNGIDVNFVGGIITGFISGYIVRSLDTRTFKTNYSSLKNILAVPLFSIIVTGLIVNFFVGDPTSYFVGFVKYIFNDAPQYARIILSAVIGVMIGFDLGGPIGRFAYLTVVVLVVQFSTFSAMGPLAAALTIPAASAGISILIAPAYYEGVTKKQGLYAILAGAFGLPEGAIPCFLIRPSRVAVANLAGCTIAAAVAAILQVQCYVPFGGVVVLSLVNSPINYIISITAGVLISLLILHSSRPDNSSIN
ncbi:MAG: fructose-specific PTS transporter subunit EIIC [Negativicutes bacterium]|jgi:fructose-specific phosphotransferase system IIC component